MLQVLVRQYKNQGFRVFIEKVEIRMNTQKLQEFIFILPSKAEAYNNIFFRQFLRDVLLASILDNVTRTSRAKSKDQT